MRRSLVFGLVVLAGCGDNEPACGSVELMSGNRNIWGGQIAVDAERIYYSDYDNGVGTHLVFLQPRDGGQELVIAARGESSRFGFGMATDDNFLYFAAEMEPTGYQLLATPLLGGRTLELSAISQCTAHGIAIDAANTYAGAVRCNDGIAAIPSHVIAVPRDGSPTRELWSSTDADVSSIAALGNGDVVLATTAGLIRISSSGSELLDGRPSYHVIASGDDIIYSTDEAVLARPAAGLPRTLYTFHTPIDQPRAFAIDGADLYVVEPPGMVFVSTFTEPVTIVDDAGAAVTHIVAAGGSAYWPTLALPGSLGLIDTFSGGVFRVHRPCER